MTRTRALLAVGFVAAVGGLLALRGVGYLGGRAMGGPLRVTIGRGGDGVARLRGGAVRVQNVRVRVASPGLSIAGPLVASGRPLEDSTLRAARTPLRMRLRAGRRGVYYAVGVVTDYRRGQRRFRARVARVLCVAVGERRRCDRSYRGPGAARLAQVGGPSRYPGARVTARAAIYERPGAFRLQIALLNRTRSVIGVRDIALAGNAGGAGEAVTGPAPFKLDRRGSRSVRLVLQVRSCAPRRIDRLRADVDGQRRTIPLSLPLRVRCAG